jgi:hypothetical protein
VLSVILHNQAGDATRVGLRNAWAVRKDEKEGKGSRRDIPGWRAGGLTESHLIGVGTIPHDDGQKQDRLRGDTTLLGKGCWSVIGFIMSRGGGLRLGEIRDESEVRIESIHWCGCGCDVWVLWDCLVVGCSLALSFYAWQVMAQSALEETKITTLAYQLLA